MKKPDHMTPRDITVIQEKRRVLHNGRCSSPRNKEGDRECTCDRWCPLHGRCCDCIAHHKEHFSQPDLELYSLGWAPNCIQNMVRDESM